MGSEPSCRRSVAPDKDWKTDSWDVGRDQHKPCCSPHLVASAPHSTEQGNHRFTYMPTFATFGTYKENSNSIQILSVGPSDQGQLRYKPSLTVLLWFISVVNIKCCSSWSSASTGSWPGLHTAPHDTRLAGHLSGLCNSTMVQEADGHCSPHCCQ